MEPYCSACRWPEAYTQHTDKCDLPKFNDADVTPLIAERDALAARVKELSDLRDAHQSGAEWKIARIAKLEAALTEAIHELSLSESWQDETAPERLRAALEAK